MNESLEITSSIMRPFGPTILKVDIPNTLIDNLLTLTDEILGEEDFDNYGRRLIGQIEKEPTVTAEQLKSIGLLSVFDSSVEGYVKNLLPQVISNKIGTLGGSGEPKVKVQMKDCWGVSQYSDEYNPAHYHGNCQISSVLYLKVPEFTPRNIEGKNNAIDGCIEFLHGGSADPNSLIRPTFRVTPKVGDLYLFPSTLLHTVYPFKSIENKERRSLAFNYTFKVFDTKTGAQILGDSVNATNGTVAGDLGNYGQISNFQKKLYGKNL